MAPYRIPNHFMHVQFVSVSRVSVCDMHPLLLAMKYEGNIEN